MSRYKGSMKPSRALLCTTLFFTATAVAATPAPVWVPQVPAHGALLTGGDGAMQAAVDFDTGTAAVIDPRDGSVRGWTRLPRDEGTTTDNVVLSPRGDHLAAWGEGTMLGVWDLHADRWDRIPPSDLVEGPSEEEMGEVLFSTDGELLAWSRTRFMDPAMVEVWDAKNPGKTVRVDLERLQRAEDKRAGKAPHKLGGAPGAEDEDMNPPEACDGLPSMLWSADGQTLELYACDGTLWRVNPRTGEGSSTRLPVTGIQRVGASADGSKVALVGEDGELVLADRATGAELGRSPAVPMDSSMGALASPTLLAWSPDGVTLAAVWVTESRYGGGAPPLLATWTVGTDQLHLQSLETAPGALSVGADGKLSLDIHGQRMEAAVDLLDPPRPAASVGATVPVAPPASAPSHFAVLDGQVNWAVEGESGRHYYVWTGSHDGLQPAPVGNPDFDWVSAEGAFRGPGAVEAAVRYRLTDPKVDLRWHSAPVLSADASAVAALVVPKGGNMSAPDLVVWPATGGEPRVRVTLKGRASTLAWVGSDRLLVGIDASEPEDTETLLLTASDGAILARHAGRLDDDASADGSWAQVGSTAVLVGCGFPPADGEAAGAPVDVEHEQDDAPGWTCGALSMEDGRTLWTTEGRPASAISGGSEPRVLVERWQEAKGSRTANFEPVWEVLSVAAGQVVSALAHPTTGGGEQFAWSADGRWLVESNPVTNDWIVWDPATGKATATGPTSDPEFATLENGLLGFAEGDSLRVVRPTDGVSWDLWVIWDGTTPHPLLVGAEGPVRGDKVALAALRYRESADLTSPLKPYGRKRVPGKAGDPFNK